MKAIIQRIESASVTADGEFSGKSAKGLLILLGVFSDDSEIDAEILAKKTANLRIFCDENDKMNKSVIDLSGGALVVSNFTLCADSKKGNRPSFSDAMEPKTAKRLYEYYCERLKVEGLLSVETGVFGADMKIDAKLSGPVTITLDTTLWR